MLLALLLLRADEQEVEDREDAAVHEQRGDHGLTAGKLQDGERGEGQGGHVSGGQRA